jgi:predicted acylesterase/phospholipase RssA
MTRRSPSTIFHHPQLAPGRKQCASDRSFLVCWSPADMQAGQTVVLDRGDLSVATRASMAVPGLFAPVVMGKRVRADGGLIRNLPVDVGRQQCAQVVIAVSLASPPPRPDELTSALNLIGRIDAARGAIALFAPRGGLSCLAGLDRPA